MIVPGRIAPAAFATTLAPILAMALGACAGDPVAELEARRASYTATLGGFVVHDLPGAPKPRIELDLLVAGGSQPPLSGLTLDVALMDAEGRERHRRRAWLALERVAPQGSRHTLRIDDLDYAPGDRFAVELRSPVPASERAEYREFGELGESADVEAAS